MQHGYSSIILAMEPLDAGMAMGSVETQVKQRAGIAAAVQHCCQGTRCAYPDRLLTLTRREVRLAMPAYSGGSDPVTWLEVRSSVAKAWWRAKEAGSVPARHRACHHASSTSWHARAVPTLWPRRHLQQKGLQAEA